MMSTQPPSSRSLLSYNPSSIPDRHATLVVLIVILAIVLSNTLLALLIYRFMVLAHRPKPARTGASIRKPRGHLLIVLGSGGHTAEMISILTNLGPAYLNSRFARRTWVVSSGDGFSATRAREFEAAVQASHKEVGGPKEDEKVLAGEAARKMETQAVDWQIATVHRARRVHQSLLTTPWSALQCLRDCVRVLQGTHEDLNSHDVNSNGRAEEKKRRGTPYPDLIMTNGPATGVILVLASILLMILGIAPTEPQDNKSGTEGGGGAGALRYIYIESWARVKKLSLSGSLLRTLARLGGGRILVQWRGLATMDLIGGGKRIAPEVTIDMSWGRAREKRETGPPIEFVGAVVS